MPKNIYQLGAWFKQVRKNRGYTLNQVAGTGFSAAALSRFERGETDISSNHLTTIMLNLGLVGDDLANFQRQNPYTFPRDVIDALFAMDTDAVHRMQADYLAAHAGEENNPLLPIVDQVFEMCALPPDAGLRMPRGLEQQLIQMLAYPNTWGTFEYAVIAGCLRFGSDDFVRAVWRYAEAIAGPNVVYKAIALVWVLISASVRGLADVAQSSAAVAQTMIDDDEQLYYTSEEYPMLKVALRMHEWQVAPTKASAAKVSDTINQLRLLGSGHMSVYLAHFWRRAEEGMTGWHQELRVPEPDLVSVSEMSEGKKVALFRRIRGLSMSQTSVLWSKSSQLRIEHEDVNPSVGTMLRISAMLLIDYGNLTIVNEDIMLLYDYLNDVVKLVHDLVTPAQLANTIDRLATKITSPYIEHLRDERDLALNLMHHGEDDPVLTERYYRQFFKSHNVYFADINVRLLLFIRRPTMKDFPQLLAALQRVDATGYSKNGMILHKIRPLVELFHRGAEMQNAELLAGALNELNDSPSPDDSNVSLQAGKLYMDYVLAKKAVKPSKYGEYRAANDELTSPLRREVLSDCLEIMTK